MVEAIAPECKLEIIGIRPGEKIHEEMITATDAMNTVEYDDYFILYPNQQVRQERLAEMDPNGKGRPCEYGFSYNSENNDHFLTVEELRKIVTENPDIDLSFSS